MSGGDTPLKKELILPFVSLKCGKFMNLLCCHGNSGTVRRFLEHYSDQVELIVFVVQTDYVSYYDVM